jgi:hypothetical protein
LKKGSRKMMLAKLSMMGRAQMALMHPATAALL